MWLLSLAYVVGTIILMGTAYLLRLFYVYKAIFGFIPILCFILCLDWPLDIGHYPDLKASGEIQWAAPR